MKTIYTILIFLLFSLIGFAQIGINTTAPNAMLDISSSINGLLIPRIALTANNIAAPVVNPQGGGLVTSTMIYNTATVAGVNSVSPGYYYWNGLLWIPLGGTTSNDWKLLGNSSITTPAMPFMYGTSTIGVSENFVGTTDVNDVVIGSNNIERMRFRSTGFIGVGTANPTYKLHITKDTAGSITTFSENTFVGNTNGTGVFGSSFNNPGYGIGGQFAGGSRGVIAQANGSTSTFTVTGVLASATGSGNGFREGGNFSATGANISNKGIIADGNGATSNYGGLFSASGGVESYGGQFSASGATTNYAGDFSIFSAATTNYGGRFNVFNGAINYAGYFQALGGTKNYAIVVPSGGGTIGFGTITPNAILDVSSTTNGVLLPRIALTANNVAAPVVNPQGGALSTSTLIYNTATVAGVNGVSPGYYYWSGTLWISFTGAISNDWKVIGNAATNDPATPVTYGTSTIGATENFIGTTDANDVVVGTNNIERLRVKQSSGNVGIGTDIPSNKLHISTSTSGVTTTLSENTFSGNTNGIGIVGSSVNNPGYGIGGQFFGGSGGLEGFANASNYSGTAVGIKGFSFGDGGASAYRVGGSFESSGANGSNYGGQFSATGGTNNYGANFQVFGGSLRNYGGNFTVSGGTTGNWGGIFNSTGGATATGADFIANNGTSQTTAGYFQAIGTSINYGTRAIVSNGAINYGGSFITNGLATSINYCGRFISNGGAFNYAGYFSANGGTNNYAIVVPNGGGDVGIGIDFPTYKLHVSNSSTNNATAYVENTTNFSGIGVEGRAAGVNNGIGGRFTGSGIGVAGIGISVLGGTSPKGGVFSASSTATTNYGITADASGGISSNYAGFFTATGNTTTNVGGYFSATGAPFNNYAIIVPANEGRVGIGTSAPVDQLEIAGGFIRSTGYRCRTGTIGTYPGNVYNINWTGTAGQLWIDAFNVGTFQFTSDRRLKDNILTMNGNALSRVMQLKPVSFKYKNIPDTIFTGSDIVTEGFIADELQEVIPSAVNGHKNAVTNEGTIQPQTINTAPIISVLTKAIQEQQQIIDELKIKNNQIEERLNWIITQLKK